MAWGGMFRTLSNLLVKASNLLTLQLYNANNLMIDNYSGSMQNIEP